MAPLVGARIIGFGFENFEGELLPVLIIQTPDGREGSVGAMRDAEGNGPGFLNYAIDERPTAAPTTTAPAAIDTANEGERHEGAFRIRFQNGQSIGLSVGAGR